MKKIVLGCAAVLLSLGLLAGCNNDTDSAVTISVDNTATVVVGETLELPYTVEPEKAKVEVLNDHEEYVTASAKDGVLSLDGVAAGSATVTLVGTYKKYEEANVNIKVSVVTEGEVDQEPGTQQPGTTYPAPTGDEDPAYFGFEVDGVGYYATGTTPEKYSYEGNLTTSVDEAVLVSIEKGEEENEFYLSFTKDEAAPASVLQPCREDNDDGDDGDDGDGDNKTYITIVENEGHTNLSYAEEKSPIYWNETYGCWGDESEEYFLCYNATYGCLYCSAIASWIESSPIATLIEPAEVTSITILGPSWVNVGETITLEAVVNLGASNAVTWSTEDSDHITVEEATGVVTGVSATTEGEPVIVTATADSGVTASVEITVTNLVPQAVNTASLVSGESYYFGFNSSNTYYFFNGTTDSYGDYLLCSTTLSEAVAVKVTIDNNSYGFTFELEGTEYTIYAWPSTSGSGQSTKYYGEITFIETSNLANAKDGAVTTFTWNSTNSRFEVTLSNGNWYFGSNANYSEISLSDSSAGTSTASSFYTFVEAKE